MRFVSKRTWVFLVLTLFFVCLSEYCIWRTGCGPSWLPKVHAQEVAFGFAPDPCQVWRAMPLLDKLAAFGMFVFGMAFLISFVDDVVAWYRRRKVEGRV